MLAASSWADTDWLKILRVVEKVEPSHSAPSIPEEWATADNLALQLEIAGYRDVEVHEVPVDIPFRSYESFVDVVLTRVTQMMNASRDLSEKQRVLLKSLMIQEMKGLCPNEPGALKAVSLVAVGVK